MELADYIKNAGNGQQTFDQDLLSLHRGGFITVPEAVRHATNPNALTMALRGLSARLDPGSPQKRPAQAAAARPNFSAAAKEH